MHGYCFMTSGADMTLGRILLDNKCMAEHSACLHCQAISILEAIHGNEAACNCNVSQQLHRMLPTSDKMQCITPGAEIYILNEGRVLGGLNARLYCAWSGFHTNLFPSEYIVVWP